MTAHRRALFKTALVIGIVAIILAAATVWPTILGYVALLFFGSTFALMIYGAFRLYEEGTEIGRNK